MEFLNCKDSEGLDLKLFENIFDSLNDIFEILENQIHYLICEKANISVKGKIYKSPRQRAAYEGRAVN